MAETSVYEASSDLSTAVSGVYIEVPDPPNSPVVDEWIDVQAAYANYGVFD